MFCAICLKTFFFKFGVLFRLLVVMNIILILFHPICILWREPNFIILLRKKKEEKSYAVKYVEQTNKNTHTHNKNLLSNI